MNQPQEWWKEPAIAAVLGGDDDGDQPGARPAPMSMGFTGYGSDGKLQPKKPAAIVQTKGGPVPLHEGEPWKLDANGKMTVIPAKMTNQKQVAGAAKRMGPGLAGGGFAQIALNETGIRPVFQRVKEINDSLGGDRKLSTLSATDILNPPATPTANQPVSVARSPIAGASVFKPEPVAGLNVQTGRPGTALQTNAPIAGIDTGNLSIPAPIPTIQKTGKTEQDYRNEAMGELSKLSTGDSAYQRNIANRAVQEQGGAGAAATGAMKQELAQAGETGAGLATALQVNQRDQASQLSKLEGELAGRAMTEQQGATQALASQSLSGISTALATRAAAESGASGYITSANMRDPNWSKGGWKMDTAFQGSAKSLFESDPANAGVTYNPADPQHQAYIQGRIDNLSTSPATAYITSIKSDPNSAYNRAPSSDALPAGYTAIPDDPYNVLDANGNKVSTKKWYEDKLFPVLSDMYSSPGGGLVSFRQGANGQVEVVDNTTGDVVSSVGPQGAAAVPAQSTFDASKPADVATAKGKINDFEDLPFYFTDNDTTDYLQSHNGALPQSAQDVTNWMQTQRVYSPDDVAGDLTTAQTILSSQGVTADTSRLAQYFKDNPAKKGLPTKTEWDTWDKGTGDPTHMALFASGIMSDGEMTKPDLISYSKTAERAASIPANKGTSSNTLSFSNVGVEDSETKTWAEQNKGKTFTQNGTTYVISNTTPYAYGVGKFTAHGYVGKEKKSKKQDLNLSTGGILAYNTTSGKWVVVVPRETYSNTPLYTMTSGSSYSHAGEYEIDADNPNNPSGVLDLNA